MFLPMRDWRFSEWIGSTERGGVCEAPLSKRGLAELRAAQLLKIDSSPKLKCSRSTGTEHLSYTALGLPESRADQIIAVTG